MKRSSLPPQLLHNLKKQKKRRELRAQACVDLGKGIFGKQGGQGGSLRNSLIINDLSSLPAPDRQGGQGGKGTAPASSPHIDLTAPVQHRLPFHLRKAACRSLTYIQKDTPHPFFISMHILTSVYNHIVKYISSFVYTLLSIYLSIHVYSQVFPSLSI